jgi:hypothetical protein
MSSRILVSLVAAVVVLTAARAPFGEERATKKVSAKAEEALTQASLQGAWKINERQFKSGTTDWTDTTPALSLYIFTKQHYSYMFARRPRDLFAGDPNRPTDADKVAAYDSFVAGTGTYQLSGSTLTLRATLHKNPNEMAGEPLTYHVEIDGGTLRMTIVDPPWAPDSETRITLRRLE